MPSPAVWPGPVVLNTSGMDPSQPRSLQLIRDQLAAHGAVLLRGFQIGSAESFRALIEALEFKEMEYIYRSTPRTTVTGKIMTATEYPPALEIALHCENSFQRQWPNWLAFCCLKPAARGGQTTVADLSRVTHALGNDLVDRFERLGVRYIRHYRPHIDLSWQLVFQTSQKSEVEQYCRSQDIQFEWLNDETLRTTQTCQGVIHHRATSERLFFNQAHLFHPSNLGPEAAKALERTLGRDKLPRTARFGDNTEIPADILALIRQVFAREAIDVEWRAGDVLVLDNTRVAHGRRPFQGDRKVLTALLQ